MNRVLFSSNYLDWGTPKNLYEALYKEFRFTLDPCCTEKTAKCAWFFTPEQDGLKQSWEGHLVFMNPPYGRQIGRWIKKAYLESKKQGTWVVCLVPARTDTKWWWDYCIKGEIRFLKGRIKFEDNGKESNSATFPSAVVIFGRRKRKNNVTFWDWKSLYTKEQLK